ncbi:MAG TPA: adenylate/guanylate cyclase domain-containing protein [Acidimicrobiia bacterium]
MKRTTPGDEPRSVGSSPTQAARRSFLLGTVVYGLLGIIWGSIYMAMGLTIPAMIPFSYVGFAALVLLFYRVTDRFAISRTAILLAWLVLPLLLQVSLGGFESGSAAVLWSLAAPVGSIFVSPRESVAWAGGFVAVLLVGWVAEPGLEPAPGVTAEGIRTFFALNLVGVGITVVLVIRDFLRRLEAANRELEQEKERSEALLLNVLPASIAERLKEGEQTIADRLDEVTIVFTDLVGFTPTTQSRPADEIVDLLDDVVAQFDRLVERHHMEKIRTAGDGYMAVAGAPEPATNTARRAADLALDMLETIRTYTDLSGNSLELRIGIDSGPVIAGVIGLKKFTYDVWGDAVNTASRMESHGVPGKIHVTERVRDLLRESHAFESRGLIEVKGKGQMRTFFLVERVAPTQPASDGDLRSDGGPVFELGG